MRVFVTGATGFIGSAVVQELTANGHQVVGLARSDHAAKALSAAGVEPHRGGLGDLDSLRRAAATADGVIHLAFMHSLSSMSLRDRLHVFLGGRPSAIVSRVMAVTNRADRAAIDALGAALQGSGRPLVTTFVTMGMAVKDGRAPRPATEEDAPNPDSSGAWRAVTEEAVEAWASLGVRASIVRLAPSVHGDGDKGFVPRLIGIARKKKESGYVGDGLNRWPGVHRRDAAVLFRLALEKGVAGARYHGVADEGVPFRDIAGVIGRRLGVPVVSKNPAQAARRFGFLAPFVMADNPASSRRTQDELGWRPRASTLLEDLDRPSYFEA